MRVLRYARSRVQSPLMLLPCFNFSPFCVALTALNTLKGRVHTWRQVAATCHNNTSQRQIALCVLENFCENLCLGNRSLWQQHVAENQIRQNFVTCCGDTILLQRQRFSQKFSSTQSDLSLRCVAATCCPSCTHGVICRRDLLCQLVTCCVPTLKWSIDVERGVK